MITPHTAAGAPAAPLKPALMKKTTGRNGNGRNGFDPVSFLATAGVGRKLMNLAKKEVLFTQESLRTQFSTCNKAR